MFLVLTIICAKNKHYFKYISQKSLTLYHDLKH